MSVIGTRPQYVKASIVTRALREHGQVTEITVDTGQHFDEEMSTLLLADLPDVQPARNLGIHDDDPGSDVLDRMVEGVRAVLDEERPDVVLVYGDTNSTLAGALGASAQGLPITHVEAGLRSYNPAMSEERTRVLVDQMSGLLLCPTPTAVANLAREGITAGVRHVGDVMYDAALVARQRVGTMTSDQFALDVRAPLAVVTIHRAETTDDPVMLERVLSFVRAEVAAFDGVALFPVHPRTRQAIDATGVSTDGLVTCPPVSYLEMTHLLMHAAAVYTDSGGLQKEAYFHRVPCVTLRNETEWVETVDAGWNRLWTQPGVSARRDIPDYGDGHAGAAIAAALVETFGP